MVAACDRTGMKLAINHQTRVSLATYRAEELLRSGAIGEFVGVRIVDKGQRPSGNSLMEMATHLFDHTRLYAGDPAWVSAHLTDAAPEPDGRRRPSTVDDIMYSQTAWPADRDCGLVLGSRATAVFGFGPASLHNGLEASFVSYNQPPGRAWPDQLELIGIEGVLALRTSGEPDLFIHRGPWGGPVQFEPVLAGTAAQHAEPPRPAGLAPELATGRSGQLCGHAHGVASRYCGGSAPPLGRARRPLGAGHDYGHLRVAPSGRGTGGAPVAPAHAPAGTVAARRGTPPAASPRPHPRRRHSGLVRESFPRRHQLRRR